MRRVDAPEARQLIEEGAVVLDALPETIWRQEHLPTARSMPLEDFEPSRVDDLDRDTPLVVYCFDQHCDLSARLSRRLDHLGFEQVHDLIGGRAAWTALGYPTEGVVGDTRRISRYLPEVAAVSVDGTIADLRSLPDQALPTPVLADDGVLLGALYPSARALPDDTPIVDVMIPAPGTIRPELRIDQVVRQLDDDGLDHVFVTNVDGTLVGIAISADLHV